MACIFSCIPLSFIYFFLTAKEFLFYQDYLIFGCKIKGRTKYTYDNIDSFCYYKTRGKYGEVEILEIIINQKRNKLSYLQGVDIDALLANLKVKIPSRELFNGKEAFDIRIKKNVRTFYIVWITFLTVAFLYAIIRDQQINYDLVIVYIFIAFGLPLIVNTLTKYEEKKAKGKRH